MPPILRLLPLLALAWALVQPAAAAGGRGYRCTNLMGGNPFRLTITADAGYSVRSEAQSRQQLDGSGRLRLSPSGISYAVESGPLADILKVTSIDIASPTALYPSGADGLLLCNKAK